MDMCPRVGSLLTCCLGAVAVAIGGQIETSLAISHVAIVDVAAGAVLPDRTVRIVGDRVLSVEPAGDETPRAGLIVDARGKYLMPGLWDMHVHLSYARASALPALIANGVIYVRDVGSRLAEIDEWRGQIDAGSLVGPFILRAGPMLNGHESNRYQLTIANAADAAATVRTLHKAGVDLIKVHRRTSREVYFAVAAEAKRVSLPLAGHVPMTLTPAEASNAGHATIEHTVTLFEGTFAAKLSEAELPAAIARWRRSPAARELAGTFLTNGTVVDPTLVTLRRLNAWLENPTDPRDKYIAASAWREAATILDPLRKDAAQLLIERRALARETEGVIGDLHAAGVRMITGTDLSFTLIHPGFSLHDELEALVDVGLTPLDAIRAATLTPSRLFPQVEGGEIAAGKRANLVLLDDNPFADIRNAGKFELSSSRGDFTIVRPSTGCSPRRSGAR